jgi:TrmH family RNA methyltransferase
MFFVDAPDEFHDVVENARRTQTLQKVSTEVLHKIGYGQSARGVVAEFHQPLRSLEMLSLPKSPLILVLDQIEKPGNVGAVFRCADAAGVDAVILSDACDLFNPNAIRGSLGAVFRVPSAVASAEQTLEYFVDRRIRVLAARVESSNPLWEIDLLGPLAIVLGSEAEGLAERWRMAGPTPIEGIRIPMFGAVDSLNVAVSAAVISYEALRVRSRFTT